MQEKLEKAFLELPRELKLSKESSLYYVSKETGWVGSQKLRFLLTFSTIYADKAWVRKSPKMC